MTEGKKDQLFYSQKLSELEEIIEKLKTELSVKQMELGDLKESNKEMNEINDILKQRLRNSGHKLNCEDGPEKDVSISQQSDEDEKNNNYNYASNTIKNYNLDS